jgi:hypothetical protein
VTRLVNLSKCCNRELVMVEFCEVWEDGDHLHVTHGVCPSCDKVCTTIWSEIDRWAAER